MRSLLAMLFLCASCNALLPLGANRPAADRPDLAGPPTDGPDLAGPSPADGRADRALDAIAGWLAGFPYRKRLTPALAQKDLTDFPLLVSFPGGDPDLAQHAAADGRDLVFTDSDGTTRLSHELEAPVGTAGKLVAWVKLPLLSSKAKSPIYLYYGDLNATDQSTPSAVWSNGFIAVWHFHSSPPVLLDSTAGANDGKTQGPMTASALVAGQIGQAYQFDGVAQRVVVNSTAVRPSGAFQISAWFRLDASDTDVGDDVLVGVMGDQGGIRGWDLSFDGDFATNPCRRTMFRTSPDGIAVPEIGWGEACPGDWHLALGAFDPANQQIRFQLDDSEAEAKGITFATQNVPAGVPLVIAAEYAGLTTSYTGGTIDEMRMEIPRSGAWIAACFANQSSPQGFVTAGPEEPLP